MTDFIYYAVANVEEYPITSILPENLQKHAYKVESVVAWSLLVEKYKTIFNQELPKVFFIESGKPIIQNGYISLSHSNGVVAVCFSKTAQVGVDVELIKDTVPKNASRFLSENIPIEFYKKWTMREAVIKVKNYSALKKGAEAEFIGITEVFTANEKAFSLSVYGENAKFIKV